MQHLCRLYDLKISMKQVRVSKEEICRELWANRTSLYNRLYDGSPQVAKNSLAPALFLP